MSKVKQVIEKFKKVKTSGIVIKSVTNISHMALGFLTIMLLLKTQWVLAVVLFVCFITYEVLDYLRGEDRKETIRDIQEYIVGMIFAIVYYSINILGIKIPSHL